MKCLIKSFVSFYDYNRTTCGWMRYMFGLEINVYRRLMWVAVFFTGFCYSIYHVGNVTRNYLEYNHSIKEKIVTTSDEFPVITICLNSMHSRRKVKFKILMQSELLCIIDYTVESSKVRLN